MDFLYCIIALAFIVPFFCVGVLIAVCKKDKLRGKDGVTVYKYGSKRKIVPLSVFGILYYIGALLIGILCYFYGNPIFAYILSPIMTLLSLILFMYAIACKYGFIVLHKNCITNACIFKSDSVKQYSNLKYYSSGHSNVLSVINKYGMREFSCYNLSSSDFCTLKQALEDNNIVREPENKEQRDYCDNSKIMRNKSRKKIASCTTVCIVFLALAFLVFFLPENTDYKHYPVEGIINSFTVHKRFRGGDWYEFTLEDDDSVYCLDNIVAPSMSDDPETVFFKGSEVNLKIADTDSSGQLTVSYIEHDGKVYLTTDDFEKAHKSNYTVKHVVSYVSFALSGISIAMVIYYLVIYLKNKRKD